MINPSVIIRVAVFSPLRRCFDYLVPDTDSFKPLLPGLRVLVPFGRKERIGIITDISDHSDLSFDKLKPISKILDDTPLFPSSIYRLVLWASQYYHHPIGEVFETALPNYLRKGKLLPEVSYDSIVENTSFVSQPFAELNEEQTVATHCFLEAITQSKFQAFLLQGVTGSGKTEVYMAAIQKALEQQKQALILVPEIGLTPQMLQRLTQRFSVPIAVLHSGLTEKQRFLAWNQARLGIAPIVLGTRSATFTPLARPGVFIVDEEHDASFKQQEGIRYSARDLLMMRGTLEQCPVILGSATPSLETLYNVEKQRYRKLSLSQRANFAKPPKMQIVDIRHKKLKEGLSHALIKHIGLHLEAKGQVLLFLNRRGFAPVFMCYDCGYIAQCKHCDAKLTLHYKKRLLKCHHCDYTIPLQSTCPSCQGHNVQPLGVGTERLEAALLEEFPGYPVLRIDKDTTRKKGSLKTAVEQIQKGEAQILLGTQMLAKGHHFPDLSLVAILDIDNALFSLDFRGTERLGQLLTQVAGRAGRAKRLGEVLLQTCHPTHPLIQQLIKDDYDVFSDNLLNDRRMACLPPYSYQALLRAEAKNSETVFNFLNKVKLLLLQKKSNHLEILGPVTAPMERRSGKYHAQLLLQSTRRHHLQNILATLPNSIDALIDFRSVRWSLDVDPIEMF